MERISCELIVWSDNGWIQQILTGLALLHRREFIDLSQTIVSPGSQCSRQLSTHPGHLQLIVDGSINLIYDMSDHAEISATALDSCDFYFKRSFCRLTVEKADHHHQSKIFPLCMNYPVFPDWIDSFALRRSVALFPGKNRFHQLIRVFDINNKLTCIPRLLHAEAPPSLDENPRIFFLTRAWNPEETESRNDPESKDFGALNELRAECIRKLKTTFSGQFVGGFTHTDYGAEHYPELILRDKSISKRRNYLRILRSCPICISTEGLHGCNPWKIGEYISLSKAIVAEPLNHQVPGNFEKGTHFLEFQTADECVSAVRRLVQDPSLRHQMMAANYRYYQAYLRPDSLVMNSILAAAMKHDTVN